MPLKHSMKVFNALKNYLVESIGYDNDAQHLYASTYASLSKLDKFGWQGVILIQIPLYASALFFPPTKVPKPIDGIFAPDRSSNEFISGLSKNEISDITGPSVSVDLGMNSTSRKHFKMKPR